eukprot:1195832-Prorocentrum_minimum.AAC.2
MTSNAEITSPGTLALCQGTLVLCQGTLVLCQGTLALCQGTLSLCQGTLALWSSPPRGPGGPSARAVANTSGTGSCGICRSTRTRTWGSCASRPPWGCWRYTNITPHSCYGDAGVTQTSHRTRVTGMLAVHKHHTALVLRGCWRYTNITPHSCYDKPTLFYGSSCANNGKGALNTPDY